MGKDKRGPEENAPLGLPWNGRRGRTSEADVQEDTEALGLPWKVPSRQVQGRLTEQKILKRKGARIHPNSGAGRIKDDGSDAENIYEIKDAVETHQLKARDLRGLRKRAIQQGKNAIYIVKFPGFTLECRIVPDRGHEYDE